MGIVGLGPVVYLLGNMHNAGFWPLWATSCSYAMGRLRSEVGVACVALMNCLGLYSAIFPHAFISLFRDFVAGCSFLVLSLGSFMLGTRILCKGEVMIR